MRGDFKLFTFKGVKMGVSSRPCKAVIYLKICVVPTERELAQQAFNKNRKKNKRDREKKEQGQNAIIPKVASIPKNQRTLQKQHILVPFKFGNTGVLPLKALC